MEFLILRCPLCATAETFWTADEVAAHRFIQHERPLPPFTPRLDAESGTVGRARQTPWQADQTHWHEARIAGRA